MDSSDEDDDNESQSQSSEHMHKILQNFYETRMRKKRVTRTSKMRQQGQSDEDLIGRTSSLNSKRTGIF